MPRRMLLVVALVLAVALTVGVPTAGAQLPFPGAGAFPSGGAGFGGGQQDSGNVAGSGPCSYALSGQDNSTGRTSPITCGVLAFTGPSVGQVASVIGPTIISPGFVGNVAVGNGDATITPVP